MTFILRPYQEEAQAALDLHIRTKATNPCVVLPTGSGKSVSMASIIKLWHEESPHVRGCILAHRKELVQQNADKLNVLYPGGHVGVFSAGLERRDYDSPLLFASIDSIFKKAGEFTPFDFIFVDEAHRIPPAGEGKYRTFIAECKKFNPALRVVGWTATPFRMGCGPICHEDHILQEVCYEAKVTDLIKQGFLANLRSKVSATQPDLSEVRKNNTGDYIVKSLSKATNRKDVVGPAISEALFIMQAHNRKAAIFFCVDVEHCIAVSKELLAHGVVAPCVTGKTKKDSRDRIIRDFKAKLLKAVCCVNVLTEGFDAPHIDCIVLLRPTLSAGLFSQMVGRGLRIYPDKKDCIVLDFAGCIEEHGPVDLLGTGLETVMATCAECRESFSHAIRACPACGWVIPPQEVEAMEREEAERRMHAICASKKSILSDQPDILKVDAVTVARHIKPGSPDSMRVQYRCAFSQFQEWICLDHEGYAGKEAHKWWFERFGRTTTSVGVARLTTVSEALENLLTTQTILDYTDTITVRRNGKHKEIIAYNRPIVEEE